MIALACTGLLAAVALGLVTWIASVPLRDASIADRVWPLLVALPAAVYAWRLGLPWDAESRASWMLLLLAAWALRLGFHINRRNWGHGEDRRYAAMRAEHGSAFAWRSLFTVFLLQAVLAWIVSWPVLAAAARPRALTPWDVAGAALALGGIVFEAIADAQLARFRANPASRNRVMEDGLWRWSRHPNYFGEACTWWGLGVMAVAGGGFANAWSLASPLLMTVLLLRVSGVQLLERDIAERRPGYREYVQRTSAFFPRPPRRPT